MALDINTFVVDAKQFVIFNARKYKAMVLSIKEGLENVLRGHP